ncbi:MAG: YfcE family phosphodiesterase [Oscillospiraceae bacterium]|nr:YfcE family phosphodiesterase [Oscillospiraceae bacterium]
MKILVFSDSHRSWSGMIQAIDEQQPDQVIHLGDLISDAEEMSYLYPKLPICMVSGNCDGWTTVPAIKQITLQGHSILLSHGHLWGVKSGYDAAVAQARAAEADILLFGHTHQPLCQQLEDGLWVLNPGPSRSSCGVILLEDGLIRCTLTRLG